MAGHKNKPESHPCNNAQDKSGGNDKGIRVAAERKAAERAKAKEELMDRTREERRLQAEVDAELQNEVNAQLDAEAKE